MPKPDTGGIASRGNLEKIGIVVFIFVAVLWAASMFAPGLFTAVGGQPTGAGAGAGQVTGTGICPTTGLTALQHKVSYVDTTNNNVETQANTSVAVYLVGSKTATVTGTTGTSGYTAVGSVNCGDSLKIFYGDGGTNYYYQEKDVAGADTNKALVYVDSMPKKSSAVTMTFDNKTTFGQATVGVVAVSGTPNSDAKVSINSGSFYFGDGAFEICAQFDTTNVTSVSFGADANLIANDASISVSTGKLMKCYEVAKPLFNTNIVQLPVYVQVKGGVLPDNSSIDIYVNDKSGYLKDGNLVPGYYNADTNADLGKTVVSAVGGVVLNPA